MLATPAIAQSQTVVATVSDPQDLPLPGAMVTIETNTGLFVSSAVTDVTGKVHFPNIVAGTYVVTGRLLGFNPHEESISVTSGGMAVSIRLEVGSFSQEVVVSGVMPEVATQSIILATAIESRVAQDLAQSLRDHAGVTALRRGAINLDPAVRGLYAEQIGVFVNGTRTFAAGPARMDSGLSHVSPHALQLLHVIRGPYALTWGAGALSAIQAETFKPAFTAGEMKLGGRAGYNYGENGSASDAFASVHGSTNVFRFVLQHNSRTGSDYTDGHGDLVSGDYESFDSRWDFGVRLNTRTLLEYSGGYQRQNDIDYPGRILDATFFETQSHAFDVVHVPLSGALTEVTGQFYVNRKDHLMNNDNKPTAKPMVGRMPPFGIDVDLPAEADTSGARAHVNFGRGPVRYKVGFDAYRLDQSATRTISRRDDVQMSGMSGVMFQDIVWPDARMSNIGGYAQVVADRGVATYGATVRVDTERARVGEVSQFFRQNTTGDFTQENTNLSAAANISIPLGHRMSFTAGTGSVVRNPSVLERYSDRFPAVKFQTAAEFLGNPGLVPERSNEFNLGALMRSGRGSLEVDYFYRVIDDYITIAPDVGVRKRLPLSPPMVFRYVQSDEARFHGLDLRAQSPVTDWVEVFSGWSYVHATDTRVDEPLFGIAPHQQRYGMTWHTLDRAYEVSIIVTGTSGQDRVAKSRFEQSSEGWTTIDLQATFPVVDGLILRAGVKNLTDEFYVNHLNSFNPFTGARIAEVGRRAYVGTEYAF